MTRRWLPCRLPSPASASCSNLFLRARAVSALPCTRGELLLFGEVLVVGASRQALVFGIIRARRNMNSLAAVFRRWIWSNVTRLRRRHQSTELDRRARARRHPCDLHRVVAAVGSNSLPEGATPPRKSTLARGPAKGQPGGGSPSVRRISGRAVQLCLTCAF